MHSQEVFSNAFLISCKTLSRLSCFSACRYISLGFSKKWWLWIAVTVQWLSNKNWLTSSTSDWSNVNYTSDNTFEFDEADASWYGNSIGTCSLICLSFNFRVRESRDSSIPQTSLETCASALSLILAAASLHFSEVSEAANAAEFELANVDPNRNTAKTTADKVTKNTFFLINKARHIF